MADVDFPLAEFIGALRAELRRAQQNVVDEDLRFKVEDIEVELQVVARNEEHAGAGVKFYVVNAEAGGRVASQTVHKLRLKLSPIDPSGSHRDMHLGDRDRRSTEESGQGR